MSAGSKQSSSMGVKGEGAVKREDSESPSKVASAGSGGVSDKAAGARDASPAPPTTFRDLPLYSTSLEDWKYHLMKLASFSKVDPSDPVQFPWPVKLNRKWPPKLKEELPLEGDPVLDTWGKPVVVPPKEASDAATALNSSALSAADGKKKVPLLWPGPDDDVHLVQDLLDRLDGPKAPTADASLIGPSSTSNIATRAKSGLFQKRVREVYKASSAARKTHNEEIMPWILEDYDTSKEWESRRKESRRGLKALQQGVNMRREGGRFPSRPKEASGSMLKKEEGGDGIKEEQGEKQAKLNHAPWIGKLEGEAHESASTSAGGAMSHALFIFDERNNGGFRVVPVSRMYKFLQKPAYANNLSWEDAEKAFERHQKAQAGEGISKFLARNTEGRSPLPRQVRAKNDEEDRHYFSSLSQSRGLNLPGSSKRGNATLANLYDRDSSARRNKLMAVGGASTRGTRIKDEDGGTYGELDFEEDFADDEERNEGDDYAMGEEETKELEQRIKRELARAEEQDKEGEDEVDDLFGGRGQQRGEDDVLTGSGKQMKKIMKALARREGNDVYDDDEERNPYGSGESSDEGEDSVMANPEEALRRVREEREREAKEAAKAGAPKTEGQSKETSRAVTPNIKSEHPSGISTPSAARVVANGAAQGHRSRPGAGHATAAQRATSPSRLGNASSRQGSRQTSPTVEGGGASLKRKSDVPGSSNGKRARTSTQQSSQPSQPSSPVDTTSPRSASPSRPGSSAARTGAAGPIAPPNELEMEIIRLVQTGRANTAKELISHFKARLNSTPAMRESFATAVTRVLNTNKPQRTLSVKPGLVD